MHNRLQVIFTGFNEIYTIFMLYSKVAADRLENRNPSAAVWLIYNIIPWRIFLHLSPSAKSIADDSVFLVVSPSVINTVGCRPVEFTVGGKALLHSNPILSGYTAVRAVQPLERFTLGKDDGILEVGIIEIFRSCRWGRDKSGEKSEMSFWKSST